MKILHTISGMGTKCGGTTSCTYELAKGLYKQNINISILTYAPDANDHIIGDDVFIRTVPRPGHFVSNPYKRLLKAFDYQLVHANGLWEYTELITARIARKTRKPYVISPHGMLYPQALAISKFKKQLFLKLFLMKDLNKAAAIHATCMEEMQHLRNLGVKSPIAVIPNPIVYEYKPIISQANTRKQIGFIGRFHPIKNIDNLIDAFKKVNHPRHSLILIGSGPPDYENFLKEKAAGSNILFPGFLDKKAKENIFNSLSYVVLPSHSENFGMAVTEALLHGIPVIASKGTPWEDLNTHKCGWWIDNDVDTLAETIQKAIETPERSRIAMGKRGQVLVRKNYSVEVVAKKMIRLYEWILNGGEKPEFVY
ncbi:MAG: glycosyltransferase [Dysgonamonadaceae bacterium]|jgi:glycosyltransferase involved in cell wall biosynthesis|nr:glycosyltransferase [Dysgonamonadaceae bacterium]